MHFFGLAVRDILDTVAHPLSVNLFVSRRIAISGASAKPRCMWRHLVQAHPRMTDSCAEHVPEFFEHRGH